MHPYLISELAKQRRSDMLAAADRYRTAHPRSDDHVRTRRNRGARAALLSVFRSTEPAERTPSIAQPA